jgi:hypothetical protein
MEKEGGNSNRISEDLALRIRQYYLSPYYDDWNQNYRPSAA